MEETSVAVKAEAAMIEDLLRAIGGGLGYGVLFSGPIGAAGGALLGGVMGHRYVLTFD